MSFYSYIVIEVKKEVYKRMFRYWVTKYWEDCVLYRPPSIFDTGSTYVMEFHKNHAMHATDYADWLADELGMDYSDFHIESYPEDYAFRPSEIDEDKKEWYSFDYGRAGDLEPSFVVTDWEKVAPKEGVEFVPYKEVYRKPDPSSETEVYLERMESIMKNVLEEIRETNALLSEIHHTIRKADRA